MVIWHWNHSRLALKTSNCAALSRKNAHAAQSLGNWETWSTWARVPADDECLSAPWREECREREEWGGGRMVRKRRDGKSREQGGFCIGGGEEELHHKGIWKQSIYKGVSFPFFSQKERETDHKQELLTLFSLVINCALPAVLSEYTTPIQAHCSSWQKKQMKSNTNEMTVLVCHVLLLIFAWSAAELCSCRSLCVWGVVVELTLHILPFPQIWGPGPFLLTTLEPYPVLCSIH